jgi:flagellar biosynthetic protein FliO
MWALVQGAGGAGDGYVEIIWWDYLKILLALGVLVAGAWAFLRYVAPRLPALGGGSTDVIRVLARYPLEPRKTLYIVRVGEEILLLGSSENSVTMLRALPPEMFRDAGEGSASRVEASGFAKVLESWRRRK